MVAADPAPAVADLDPEDRARLQGIEVRLIERAVERRGMVSALDLDEEAVVLFLERALGVADLFAFALDAAEGDAVTEAVLLYLGEDSLPFRDPDMYALASLGALLALADRNADAG